MHYTGSACVEVVTYIVIKISWWGIAGHFLTNSSNYYCADVHILLNVYSVLLHTTYRLTELCHPEHTLNFFSQFSSSRLKPNYVLRYFFAFLRPHPLHTHAY